MSEILMPYYKLYIGGTELSDFQYSMIKEISFEDNSSGSDLLTISIEDPEFIFIDDDIFIEENQVKFIGGYDTDNRVMFEGYISLIDVNFPDTGSPSLVIHCMDNTHLMNRVKKKRSWENTTRAKVAQEIFREYGFKVVIHDSGKVEETISQSDETDINFIIKLSEEEIDSYLVYVESGTAYYVRKELLSSPQATLDYRDGNMQIISFSPRINKETKQVETRKSEVNLLDKEVDKGQANNNTDRTLQGADTNSTDRRDGQSSWTYGGNGKWTQTY